VKCNVPKNAPLCQYYVNKHWCCPKHNVNSKKFSLTRFFPDNSWTIPDSCSNPWLFPDSCQIPWHLQVFPKKWSPWFSHFQWIYHLIHVISRLRIKCHNHYSNLLQKTNLLQSVATHEITHTSSQRRKQPFHEEEMLIETYMSHSDLSSLTALWPDTINNNNVTTTTTIITISTTTTTTTTTINFKPSIDNCPPRVALDAWPWYMGRYENSRVITSN